MRNSKYWSYNIEHNDETCKHRKKSNLQFSWIGTIERGQLKV